RRSPASYCAQFLTLNFIFGMWCRRSALCLFGMAQIGKALDNPRQPTRPRRDPCNNALGVAAPLRIVRCRCNHLQKGDELPAAICLTGVNLEVVPRLMQSV